jgi:hypothetical protein
MEKYFIEICVKDGLDSSYVRKQLETLGQGENPKNIMKVNELEYTFGNVLVLPWNKIG